jgi:hypothetical protein
MSNIKLEGEFYYFDCPNCELEIIVHKNELFCQIFRHGVFKNTYEQVDPHLCKEACDRLVKEEKVLGCCRPFEIIKKNKVMFAVKCDYK